MNDPGVPDPDRGSEQRDHPVSAAGIRRILRPLLGLGLLAVFISLWFWIAGRVTWVQGWIFLAVAVVYTNALEVWLARTNPELHRERRRRDGDYEPWDMLVVRFYNLLMAVMLVVAAIDSGRFRWSVVPIAAQVAAWVCLLAAALMIMHVVKVNPYLYRMVCIQRERGHVVITKGLYRLVRHPMYLGIVIVSFSAPIALASFWALVPGLFVAATIVYRAEREDRTLMEKLPGYREYAERVTRRLFPGIW